MAKILIISRNRNSTVESIVSNLATDEMIISPVYTGSPRAQTLLKIFALYLRLQPDLVYFIFEDENLNWLEKSLTETLGAVPYQHTAVTFIGRLRTLKSPVLKRFLKRVDLLTLATRQDLADLRGLNSQSRRQLRALLAPMPPMESEERQAPYDLDQEALKYLSHEQVWIFPWDFEYFKMNKSFFTSVAKEKTWVFLGDRSQWKFQEFESFSEMTQLWVHQPLWFHSHSRTGLYHLMEGSEILLLAGLDGQPSEFVKWASLGALTGLHTILDTHQVEMLSSLWRVGENCSLIQKENVKHELENRWVSGSLSSSNRKKNPRSPAKALDESLNELSRWIQKTLATKKVGEI